jgi:hypothetical protein
LRDHFEHGGRTPGIEPALIEHALRETENALGEVEQRKEQA